MGFFGVHGRGRAPFGLGAAAVLLLSACGGGSSKSSDTTAPSDGGTATNVTSSIAAGSGGGNGKCFQTPGTQTAKVRFVNLYTNAANPAADIDVWQGFSGTDPCGKKLVSLKFGEASDYLDVTAADESGNWEATGYVAGSTAQDHEIISQSETWKGGEQATIIFQGSDPTTPGLSPNAGGDQTFFEKPVSDINPEANPVAGKGLLLIGAASTQYVVKDGAWVAGIAGQTKCLMAVGDTENTRTNIGGTSLVPYPVTPGTLSVSLYKSDPGTCTGTPDLGPISVDVPAGGRAFVLAYGSAPSNVKLLALPIPS